MVCRRIEEGAKPENALMTWQDMDETFGLYRRDVPLTEDDIAGDWQTGLIHENSCRSVWQITPNIIVRIHPWIEGVELEYDTLVWISENAPDVPTAKAIYSWIDRDWNRDFLIMERVPGLMLETVWPRLNETQVRGIARQVAEYCTILGQLTSPYCERATGAYITGGNLLPRTIAAKELEFWMPFIHDERYTVERLTELLTKLGNEPCPNIGEVFHFYNSDLSPTNIFVSEPSDQTETPTVTALIDWECAAFYPHWFLSTVPLLSPAFHLPIETAADPNANWSWILTDELEAEGWVYRGPWIRRYRSVNTVDGYRRVLEEEGPEDAQKT